MLLWVKHVMIHENPVKEAFFEEGQEEQDMVGTLATKDLEC